jgi:hypothetical protein
MMANPHVAHRNTERLMELLREYRGPDSRVARLLAEIEAGRLARLLPKADAQALAIENLNTSVLTIIAEIASAKIEGYGSIRTRELLPSLRLRLTRYHPRPVTRQSE